MIAQKTCSPTVGPRGLVGEWRLPKNETQQGEELTSGPQQVVQLDVENADRYQRWKKKKREGERGQGWRQK